MKMEMMRADSSEGAKEEAEAAPAEEAKTE
jgi:hypothetical protein